MQNLRIKEQFNREAKEEIRTPSSTPFLGVTCDGRVKNMVSGKWLATCDNGHGYKQVFVNVNGKRYVRYIHRLVAECYISNPNNYNEINHKDGNKSNNCVDNLEWCTRSYNSLHALATGLRPRTTEKQRAAASKTGKRNIKIAREGWGKWSQTDKARKVWLKNLEKADRWGTRNEPAEVKAARRREKKRIYRQEHREELSKRARERYANMTDEQRAARNAKKRERYARQKANDATKRP